jgi:hypothetical protein
MMAVAKRKWNERPSAALLCCVILVRQSNWLFASLWLTFSLFRFLHPHRTKSVNARYLCEAGEIELPIKTMVAIEKHCVARFAYTSSQRSPMAA